MSEPNLTIFHKPKTRKQCMWICGCGFFRWKELHTSKEFIEEKKVTLEADDVKNEQLVALKLILFSNQSVIAKIELTNKWWGTQGGWQKNECWICCSKSWGWTHCSQINFSYILYGKPMYNIVGIYK